MKKRTIFFATAAAIAVLAATQITPCRAQTPRKEPSPLVFDVAEFDFGTIREEGGAVSHTFEFTNTGPNPIPIDRAVASCGCTVPDYPRRTIAPGARGKIKVTFNPMGYPGQFSKSVTVVSGGGKYSNTLTISGNVTPRIKTVEEEYPHEMGGGVRLDAVFVPFRTISQGRMVTTDVRWINISARDVRLALEPVEASGMLDIDARETLCGGCRGEIALTYDLRARTHYGMAHDVVRLVVDGVPSAKTLYTAMTGVDDFLGVELGSAPRFFLDAQYHNFGRIRRRIVPYTYRLTASNEGSTELHIRSVEVSGGRSNRTGGAGSNAVSAADAEAKSGLNTTLRAGMTIAAGASLPFEVMLYAGKFDLGDLSRSIIVVVDDPLRPVREIRLAAEIVD